MTEADWHKEEEPLKEVEAKIQEDWERFRRPRRSLESLDLNNKN